MHHNYKINMIFMSKGIDEKYAYISYIMFYVKYALNVEQSISFKHIFKHIFFKKHGKYIFNIISTIHESSKVHNSFIQQLSRNKHNSSIWNVLQYQFNNFQVIRTIFHKHRQSKEINMNINQCALINLSLPPSSLSLVY